MRPMPRPDAGPVFDDLTREGFSPLLDIDALDFPRRLSRDEGRRAAGPDWFWTHPTLDEDSDND